MKSWILIIFYLWKDTWKNWFEQPGSILARLVVTAIMVTISMILLVAFSMQVDKIRDQLEEFGVDNMFIMEMVSASDLQKGKVDARFADIGKWGDLLVIKKLLTGGVSSSGNRVAVFSYDESSVVELKSYLDYGFSEFVLTNKHPKGMLLDVEVGDEWIRTICLPPDPKVAKVLQGDTLLVPSANYEKLEEAGYSVTYFLQRHQSAPSISMIADSVKQTISADRRGRVDIRSTAELKKKLKKLKTQQAVMRYTMAGLLGGALALIYGTLSVLEFRQQRYVAALMRSFGVPKVFLIIRGLLENLFIVNSVFLLIIYFLMKLHDSIFSYLKLKSDKENLLELYFSSETMWILLFVNVGVVLSSIPVIKAMSKPVGKVLN